MESPFEAPPLPTAAEVRLWGIPDRSDWANGFRLRARSRPIRLKLFWWLLAVAYLTFAFHSIRTRPEMAFLLMFFLLVLWLRLRRQKSAAIDRIMAKAARSGGCPHWCFDTRYIHLQSGPNEFFYEWKTLDKVVADSDLVVLVSNRYSFDCIPTRFFKGPGEVTRLLTLARGASLPVMDYRNATAIDR